jgi:hypothetical protein
MYQTCLYFFFSLFLPFFISECPIYSNLSSFELVKTEWILSDLISKNRNGIQIKGKPVIIKCKYGKAVEFNGFTDGVFLDSMPLRGMSEFTVEAIVRPDSGGNFEQRMFHTGEINGDRVLLETRSVQNGWYYDAFIKSGVQQKTMVDSNLVHPFNQWYTLAFVIAHGKIETYINGQKELESNIAILPILGEKTSIGVRQNEKSWFKGAIYKIRISPEALKPDQFMVY